ncbi:MAG: HK97 family phage prohead protease [Pseudomonadota bacterium]
MQTKAMTITDMTGAGTGRARIATLSAVDSDGDTYDPGAFAWKAGGVQWVPILVAHNRGMMPFGKAMIFEEGDEALADLHLNLDTQAGRDWHAALKFDLETGQPVQEWSYGYDVLDAGDRGYGQSKVRVLKQLDVHEISTVVRGAGVGSATLSIKSAELEAQAFAPLIAGLAELAAALPDDPAVLSATGVKQLEQLAEAIGTVLAPMRDAAGKERRAVDTALAEYLLGQYRRRIA